MPEPIKRSFGISTARSVEKNGRRQRWIRPTPLPSALRRPGSGTTPTYRDVCHLAAFGGEADISQPLPINRNQHAGREDGLQRGPGIDDSPIRFRRHPLACEGEGPLSMGSDSPNDADPGLPMAAHGCNISPERRIIRWMLDQY